METVITNQSIVLFVAITFTFFSVAMSVEELVSKKKLTQIASIGFYIVTSIFWALFYYLKNS